MSQDIVAKAKADLEARGVTLSGACGAIKITNLVAWRLRPQYYLLRKGGGNRAVLKADGSCLSGDQTADPEGFATDYLIDKDTFFGFDVLGDGGGNNSPQWAGPETAPEMVARNRVNGRVPLDPAGYFPEPVIVAPPEPDPMPAVVPPPSDDLGLVLAALRAIDARLAALEARTPPTYQGTGTVRYLGPVTLVLKPQP
jgi:hypothetical protein